MPEANILLVAGASGNLGRLVVEALLRSGAPRLIATSRTPEKLADLAKRGVEVRAADYARPEGLPAAFRGATHLLLISTQDVGPRLEQHVAAFEAARAAGVRHIFYTSHTAADVSVSVVAPEHAEMERRIMASGMDYTILRNNLYSENLTISTYAEAFMTGTHHDASRGGKVGFVSRRDCADAAAGAMLDPAGHVNRVYDITGPEALGFEEILHMVSRIAGRDFVFAALPDEEFKARLLRNGVSEDFVEAFLSYERSAARGEMDLVTDAVLKLSGHQPERVEDFLKANLPARLAEIERRRAEGGTLSVRAFGAFDAYV